MARVVEVSNSKEEFEIFDQLQTLEPSGVDFSHLLPAQVSSIQETSSIPVAMVLQHKSKTSLLELLESHARGMVHEVAIQTRPPTLPTHSSQPNLTNKKRKQDQNGKDIVEEGEIIPSKELEPQKRAKVVKVAQTMSSSKGVIVERGHDRRLRVQTWNPPLMLDGAPLHLNSSIRDFQKGKAGYMANAMEQPLLLLQDMANLRSLKKHKMFLTLKRDLAMVSLILYYPCFFFFFFFLY